MSHFYKCILTPLLLIPLMMILWVTLNHTFVANWHSWQDPKSEFVTPYCTGFSRKIFSLFLKNLQSLWAIQAENNLSRNCCYICHYADPRLFNFLHNDCIGREHQGMWAASQEYIKIKRKRGNLAHLGNLQCDKRTPDNPDRPKKSNTRKLSLQML